LLTFFVVTYLVTWGFFLAGSMTPTPRREQYNNKDIVPSAEPNATNPWALSHSLVAWMTVALLRMRKNTQL